MPTACLLTVVLALGAAGAGEINLAPNAGLELAAHGPRADGQPADGPPAGWAPLSIGPPAEFHGDEKTVHGGSRSVRIDAAEITRSYFRSDPVAVVAGEVTEISAWVKVRDVPADQGTVILIAEFAEGTWKGEVGKVGTAGQSPDWQHLSGRVTIPRGCDTLRIRMGLSYSRGTTWWDDVEIRPAEPLVARVEARENRLYPASQTLPVAVLNRDGRTGPVTIAATLGEERAQATVKLSGEARQRADIPIRIGRRGKVSLAMELADPQTRAAFWSSKPAELTVPLPLVMLPPIPTHWAIEDGQPRIRVELALALGADHGDRPALRIELIDERSSRVFTRELAGISASGPALADVEPGLLPAGRYRLVASIDGGDGLAITAEQPWEVLPRSEASTRLNADGYPEKAGKAIFPLGMFNNTARLEEEVEAGFNVAHFYNAARVRAGQTPDDQRLADAMNRCHALGIHVLLMVPQGFAVEGDWEGFRRRIRMFRNHPALLAWDEEEGLARGDMTMETLQRIREVLREEDPHHPLMVGDARDVIGRITDRADLFPVSEMDLGMWWWYPLPLQSGQRNAMEGEQDGTGLLLEPPTFLTRRTTVKPIWVGLQAYKKPGLSGRYPTPAEYRAQAWLALIHGARGLMWYGGSVTGGAFLNPTDAHWAELKQLAGQLRDLAPVLMSPSQAVTVGPTDLPVDAAIKRANGRVVLLAVNRGPEACTARLEVGELAAGTVRVLGENRDVEVEAGLLSDRYEAYGAHAYELSP
ncbi:MAG: carbohydrate binding domain-containing protein [Thermoguttaceae bacterium]